jgi:hypothetical protein
MRWLLLFLFTGSCVYVHSQKKLSEIEMHRIPQKKVRTFISTQQERNVFDFQDIRPSCAHGEDLTGLNEITYNYIIKEDINTVWQKYFTTSPAESWNSGMVTFGLLFSKQSDYILYRDDPVFDGISTGQVFYVNLRLLGGVYNLAVGLEIVEINEKEKYFQFSYLKEGKSKGIQTVRFYETKDDFTKIVHHTLFESDSPFRDKYLYPFFHKRAITAVHRKMDYLLFLDQRKQNYSVSN